MIQPLAKTYVIYGVSKGLGKAIAKSIPQSFDKVYGISRTNPENLMHIHWIATDLSHSEQASIKIKQVLQKEKIDVLIYNVGIWESTAFTNQYSFEKISVTEINTIIQTNINTCILSIQSLIENLKLSHNAKIILIGSTWGIDHHNGSEVIFSATKFALRGIAHSLREILREYHINVSVLNLGYLATEYDIDIPTNEVLQKTNYSLIPLSDVIQAISFIISTSKATCIKEIIMPAMMDKNI